jgi:hypothetical protein
MKTDSSSFEWVEESKYVGTNFTNQNCVQEDINGMMKSR